MPGNGSGQADGRTPWRPWARGSSGDSKVELQGADSTAVTGAAQAGSWEGNITRNTEAKQALDL